MLPVLAEHVAQMCWFGDVRVSLETHELTVVLGFHELAASLLLPPGLTSLPPRESATCCESALRTTTLSREPMHHSALGCRVVLVTHAGHRTIHLCIR